MNVKCTPTIFHACNMKPNNNNNKKDNEGKIYYQRVHS